jgi:hypothetical protein
MVVSLLAHMIILALTRLTLHCFFLLRLLLFGFFVEIAKWFLKRFPRWLRQLFMWHFFQLFQLP